MLICIIPISQVQYTVDKVSANEVTKGAGSASSRAVQKKVEHLLLVLPVCNLVHLFAEVLPTKKPIYLETSIAILPLFHVGPDESPLALFRTFIP